MNSHTVVLPDPQAGIKKYWYGDKTRTGWSVLPPDPIGLLDRLKQYGSEMSVHPSWKDAVKSGFCKDKDDYFSLLRDLCITWSKQEIRKYHVSDEVRLIKLMIILRETDLMISRLSEQISLWLEMIGDDTDCIGLGERNRNPVRYMAAQEGGDGISLLCRDITHMRETRANLAHDISTRSEVLLPNCSTLVGPLVAARLLVEAGSLERLSRMPSSGIQILGARNATFSHLSTGSPPPKHGLIFEHKRIHAAPRKVRGRVARTLAANLAVAARIDYYRKTSDPAFLEKARLRIVKAGAGS